MMKKSNSFACHKGQLLKIAAFAMFAFLAPSMMSAANDAQGIQQQERKVVGTVTDATGEPVIGATVRVVGMQGGTVTDIDGNFAIDATAGQTLEITAIGYKTQQVKINSRSVAVVVEEDALMLDEVVALGYGAQTRKADLSASVGIVGDVDKLAQRAVTSTEAMLQGQLPGVTVMSNGGDPTSTPSLVIRGQGSPSGDNVLWVVDGVPGAPIPSMSDIESIVVLKDAASAAIYGATSGAGGCVLVTTKKAKAGATSLSYDGVYGIRTASNVAHALDAAGQIELAKISHQNAGLALPAGWDVNNNPYIGTTRTDWIDEVFRSAFYQRHNVVVNTGTETTKNRLSYSYDGDNGTLRNTYNNKHTLHYNGSFDINKWVTISEDFTWRNSSAQGANTNSAENGVLMNALHMPSSATVYNADGTYGGITEPGNAYPGIHGDAINPVRLLEANNNYNKTNTAWTTTSLQIHDILPGLKFTSRFTFNLGNQYYKNFEPIRPEMGKPKNYNEMTEYSIRSQQWKTENTLTYDNSFGKHTVGALLSTTADKSNERGLMAYARNFSDESETLQYLPWAGSVSATDVTSSERGFYVDQPDANVAVVGRLAYSFDDRYFVTASLRKDWAGRLDKNNNSGVFPAFTAGWKISNESFFPKTDAINLMKIRGSWGRVGNIQSVPVMYKAPSLTTKVWDDQAQYGVGSNTTWGSFVFVETPVNHKLSWETSEQWDLGIDMAFLKNRLSLSVDYYNKRTFDLIQYQSINWPNTIGLNQMLVNLGEVKNQGVEVELGWNEKLNKDFSYYVKGNFAWQKNEVTDTGLGEDGIWTGDVYGNNDFKDLKNLYRTEKGQALNSFYLIKTDGIFQSDEEAAAYTHNGQPIQPNAKAGDLKFVDANNDGTIDDNDRQYCGSAMPKTTFSLSGGFTWKNLSFSAMLQGVGGAHALFVGKYLTLNDTEGAGFNRWDKILDAWTPQNTGSDIPRASRSDLNKNFTTASDYYLENASYLRLKNVTIGYDLTDVIRKWQHLADRKSSLYLYVTGENLFTITSYSGMDPECGGWDAMKYPLSRAISFGVKLTY